MEKKINIHTFFITDNKSGWKTRADRLKKKEPKLYNDVLEFTKGDQLMYLPFKVRVWHFIHNEPNIPKCPQCDVELKFKRSISEGYGKYCSINCTNKHGDHVNQVRDKWRVNEVEILSKIKKTNQERYGVDNTWKRLDMVADGFIRNHGVNHVSKVDGVLERRGETNIKLRGYLNNLSDPLILDKSFKVRRDEFLHKYENHTFITHTGNTLSILCNVVGHTYEINRTLFRYRNGVNVNPCTKCNPVDDSVSIQEKELQDFVLTLVDEIKCNDRETIKPKELDILIHEYNLAIEFNGLFWHSEKFIPSDYHINKTMDCESLGIDLIHVFEDEWVNNKDIVKSIIQNRLGLSTNTIYARKTVIKEISGKDYKNFCNNNHIQGHVNASVKLGLYCSDVLVSVMSFGGLRRSLGSHSKKGSFEMLRFCNKLNTNIVGGASKLFKYFIKTYNPNEIISFSDNRYFNGGLYEQLGFRYEKKTTPNYYYITDKLKRENRFKYRKDVLVKCGYDSNKTERQIMVDRGINRIYDCGNKKWVWLS